VLLAELVGEVADAPIGLLAVMIFFVFDVVGSAEDDVIVYMPTVDVGCHNIRIFSFQ